MDASGLPCIALTDSMILMSGADGPHLTCMTMPALHRPGGDRQDPFLGRGSGDDGLRCHWGEDHEILNLPSSKAEA
jgi:hypothetical protein